MSSKLFIKTFGCQMNAYDSGRMADLLAASHAFQTVEAAEDADFIILNTCHIREKAEEKLFSELGRLRKLTARRGGQVLFAVGGCVGQAQGRRIFQRAPFVNLVFGPQNYHRLPQWLDRLLQGETRLLDDRDPGVEKFDHLPSGVSRGATASVTVQEGCDKFCTYCVVPYTRGREWSRPVAEVIREVSDHLARGSREILLLGQNVNAYQSMDRDGTVYDLALLLRHLAQLDGLDRLRFVTSHPADMNDDLVELFGEVAEVCPYLHLPIQSGSDRILAAMGRGHTVDQYLAWVARLHQARSDLVMATDFIVGFPGETEEDFRQTLALAREVGFGHAYSFKFSARPGTPAAALDDPVPEAVASERLARLQNLLEDLQLADHRRQVGQEAEVLVEGFARLGEGDLTGRTPGHRKVNFAGPASLIGRIVRVAITEAHPNSLRGEVVRPWEKC